jgi:predicted phosphodiesterase
VRLQVLSDVHIEFHEDAGRSFVDSLDPSGVDVLVLAGDIAVGPGVSPALGLFCERFRESTVIYVHGNHEHYGSRRDEVIAFTKQAAERHQNLVWLDADVIEVDGRRFIGGPLWFRRTREADAYQASLADFSEIPGYGAWVYRENARMLELLDSELSPGDIVVTHHLPSFRSVAPRYSGSPLNAYFVCDIEDLIRERQPSLWIHGHTHASVDAKLGATRLLCNPFGYAGWELNPAFVDRMIVEV